MIAGLSHGVDEWVVRGDPATRAFSTFGFRAGKLAVVESVNRAGDHAAAKRIIGTTKTLTPARGGRPGVRPQGTGQAKRLIAAPVRRNKSQIGRNKIKIARNENQGGRNKNQTDDFPRLSRLFNGLRAEIGPESPPPPLERLC